MKWLHRTIIQNELASLLIKSLLNYRSKTTPQPHTCLKTPTHQLEILLKQNQLIVHLIISIQMWKCNRSKFSEKNCVFKIFLFPTDKTFFLFRFHFLWICRWESNDREIFLACRTFSKKKSFCFILQFFIRFFFSADYSDGIVHEPLNSQNKFENWEFAINRNWKLFSSK